MQNVPGWQMPVNVNFTRFFLINALPQGIQQSNEAELLETNRKNHSIQFTGKSGASSVITREREHKSASVRIGSGAKRLVQSMPLARRGIITIRSRILWVISLEARIAGLEIALAYRKDHSVPYIGTKV